MIEFWNNRYKDTDYAYGIQPNEFLKNTVLNLSTKGKALLPCEGEGRNAVFLAKNGFDVTAFDSSNEGKKKAFKLAKREGVNINYTICDFETFKFQDEYFDVISLVYAHFSPNVREVYHQQLIKALKPGGTIIIEGFSKDNLLLSKKNPKIGGPQKIDLLYDESTLKNDFKSLNIIQLKQITVELNEGKYHIGESSVVRMIAKKK